MSTDYRIDPLIAALADAEVLRSELACLKLRMEDHLQWQSRAAEELGMLNRRLDAAEERQRELQVLLLHRDEEVVRLHGYLEAALAKPDVAPTLEAPALTEQSQTAASRQIPRRTRPREVQVAAWVTENLIWPSVRRFRR